MQCTDMVKNSEAILVSSLMALCGQIQKEHRSKWIKIPEPRMKKNMMSSVILQMVTIWMIC